jgi:DNA-binding LacI/PurR family transcriptional regulator
MRKAPPQCLVLCLNAEIDDSTKRPKIVSMRRYAAAVGWTVVPIAQGLSHPRNIPELLSTYHPVGCIYDEDASQLPVQLRLFGDIPVVFANGNRTRYDAVADRVCVDSEAVARAAYRELASCKPTAFAVVDNPSPRPWSTTRINAFLALVRNSGLPFFAFRPRRGEDRESRIRRLGDWVARLPRHTAIYAVNDKVALPVIAAARAARLRLPQDLTLLGTDNEEDLCEASMPRLSSIQMDFERMGYLAARLLDERIRHLRETPVVEKVGPLLVIRRDSTRGSGRHEPYVAKAVEIIRREACDGLTAIELLSRFPGSRRLFDLRFREAMGHSALDEILHVRLERVVDLLMHTEKPIGAIAALCGFGTERELNKLFRSRFDCSLRDWRKAHAKP